MSILIPIFDGSEGGRASGILNIIILPELGTRTPTRTTNSLIQIEPSSRIFEFPCGLSPDDGMVWASLIQKGNDLLDLLLQQPELWSYPLVFLSHGLSGIIAKRLLVILDARYYDDKLKPLLDAQSGFIFISTPHLIYSKPDSWLDINSVLKSCPGYSKWKNQDEIATVANVCTKFEGAQNESPILSVYEKKESRVGEGWRHIKQLHIVDRELATIGARDETLLAIEADHLEIATVDPHSDLYSALVCFFSEVHSQKETHDEHVLQRGMQSLESAKDDDDEDTWASTVCPLVQDNQSGRAEGCQDAKLRHLSVNATIGTSEIVLQEAIVTPSALPNYTDVRQHVQLPCYFLHSYGRNPDFFGRDDVLAQMDAILLPKTSIPTRLSKGPESFVISGLGGVGKTQCALEFATSRKDKYDAVLWVHADTGPKLDESFSQLSVALGLEKPAKAGDRVVSRNLVMEWLSDPVKHTQTTAGEVNPATERANWLLIFDNADDPSLIADCLPTSGTGSVVLTSRDPLARKYLSSNGINLEPLEPDSAAALLRKLSEVKDTADRVEASVKVAKRMGGLPLAISLAAATILRQELTFEEFLALYEVEPKATDIRPISLKPENQYRHTLSTVWLHSTLEKPAGCLLRLLSVLDPDNIDENIITQKKPRELPDDYPMDKPTFIKARTSLLKSSLVKRNKSTSQLSIHRLTQDFTRVNMTFIELQDYFVAAIQLCMHYWPKPVNDVSYSCSNWPKSEAVVPHFLRLRELWQKQPSLAGNIEVKQQIADLSWRVAWYFTERGSVGEEVEPILLFLHQVCQSEPSLQNSETHSKAVFALATIYDIENDPINSLKYAELNINIVRAVGIDMTKSQSLALGYNQFGWALLINDRWKDAAMAFRNSIHIYSEWVEVKERGWRPEFPWEGLALALSEMGQNEEAADIFLETIKNREAKFGPADTESIKFGMAMQSLGDVRLKQGRLDESLNSYKKAVMNFKVTSGPRNFRLGQVYCKLGEHYALRRQISEADIHFKQALKIFKDRPSYKGECARIWNLQTQMHKAEGAPESAVNEFESRSLKLYKEVIQAGKLSVYGASMEEVNFDKVVSLRSRSS